MFDMHAVVALADFWSQLGPSEDSFVRLFPRLDDEIKRRWHRLLTDDGQRTDKVAIGTSFALRRNPPPCWIVQLDEGTDEEQVLGHVNGEVDDDGQPYKWLLESQTITITSIAGNKELVRALHLTAKAAMLVYSDWFIRAGYRGIYYAGGGDLSIDQALESELGGLSLRSQRWRTLTELEVSSVVSITRKPYLVVAADVVVDGVQGGAQPVDGGGT